MGYIFMSNGKSDWKSKEVAVGGTGLYLTHVHCDFNSVSQENNRN